MNEEIMLHPLVVAGMIGVIVSVLKNWKVPSKWYTAISLGLGLSYYVYWFTAGGCSIITAIGNGIMAGGTASGVYNGVKRFSNGNKIVDTVLNPLTLNRKGKTDE